MKKIFALCIYFISLSACADTDELKGFCASSLSPYLDLKIPVKSNVIDNKFEVSDSISLLEYGDLRYPTPNEGVQAVFSVLDKKRPSKLLKDLYSDIGVNSSPETYWGGILEIPNILGSVNDVNCVTPGKRDLKAAALLSVYGAEIVLGDGWEMLGIYGYDAKYLAFLWKGAEGYHLDIKLPIKSNVYTISLKGTSENVLIEYLSDLVNLNLN